MIGNTNPTFKLSIADCLLKIANCPIANCQVAIADCRFSIIGRVSGTIADRRGKGLGRLIVIGLLFPIIA